MQELDQRFPAPPRWVTTTLWLATGFNLLWGSWVALFPLHSFAVLHIPPPNYPALWQCVGFIIALYGVNYGMAAADPLRFWPNVAVGLLGKVIGPIGFLWTASHGQLPWRYGVNVIFCDLIWWIPFVLVLRWSIDEQWRRGEAADLAAAPSLEEAFSEARDQQGRSLLELSQRGPVLLIFLRHLGCIFCADLLAQIRDGLPQFEQSGLQPVFVHMGTDAEAAKRFAEYGLEGQPRISDPQRRIYRAFGLGRGRLGQLIGPNVIAGAFSAFLRGRGINRFGRNMDQLPGIFLVQDGKIIKRFAARSAAMFVPASQLSRES